MAGREPRHHGDHGGGAARAPPRAHRRRHRDDLVELHRHGARHRCSSASTATSTARRATSQAAINAARADLPTACASNPTYRKVNPADAPILILALTSDTLTPGQLYDSAATVVQQKLSQLPGVGKVRYRRPLAARRAGRARSDGAVPLRHRPRGHPRGARLGQRQPPKGAIETGERHYQLYANDQGRTAADYRDIVVAYRNGAARAPHRCRPRWSTRSRTSAISAWSTASPASSCSSTSSRARTSSRPIKGLKEALPQVQAALPGDIDLTITGDRSATIRASLAETEETLLIAVGLVVFVVFVFLRSWRATLIPAVAVPISIVGTFSAMYLLDYLLDILSLMALIIATGFVVDDAIVVLENIQRYIEQGKSRIEASLLGAREVGFTVISMSLSLVAVFLPILMMGGLVGRLFQEFAVTLSLAILISLVLSLTTTPMMCARLLKPETHDPSRRPNLFIRGLEGAFSARCGATSAPCASACATAAS